MPVNIPDNLPAKETLLHENIFVMSEKKAKHQDIRPLQIVILNLMPNKIATETQFLRLLSNSPLQIEITLLHMRSHRSKNTAENHLSSFYKYWDEIKDEKFDGLIVTGAPVETMEFEEVDYWQELTQVFDWSLHSVFSTLYVCWGAQAGLYYHYQIPKYNLNQKLFGVFSHHAVKKNTKLLKGFDDLFWVPHSRHTEIKKKDLANNKKLEVLAESAEAGVCVVANKDRRQFFITGHFEYDRNTLRDEYERDQARGLTVELPKNYFPENNSALKPIQNWRGHANLLYFNWLNFYVYQQTPYDLKDIK